MKLEKILRWLFFWVGVYFSIVFLVFLLSHGAAVFSIRLFAVVVTACAILDLYAQLNTDKGLSAVQCGKTVYIYDTNKRVATIVLDNDRPLTENELEQVLRDVEARRRTQNAKR